MPRFFVPAQQIDVQNKTVAVFGEDAHHISRSLRMASGEKITVCDMRGNDYDCVLKDFLADHVTAEIVSIIPTETEPPFTVGLYQALPKGDKLDMIIQKAVECGATSVRTFESEYCIARKKSESEERKLERRNKISLEAAKQCGRGIVPLIAPTFGFKDAIDEASKADIPLFCYEGEGTQSLKKLLEGKKIALDGKPLSVSVVIGSEGGFSQSEADYARGKGFLMAGLGKRILRTETASSFVLSCLVYELEL